MRRVFPLFVVAVCALALSAASRADEPTTEKTDPKLPNVPGPFHAYNVTGNYNKDYKGRYHSQISEFGLEPMVMLFTRETEFSKPLKDLLTQIDNAVENNPVARLHAFVVVLSDDLPEVAGADDKADDRRIELAKSLETQAAGLKHVDVVLAGKDDLAKYKLGDAAFAFFLFQRDKVTASRVLLKKDDKLTDADVKAIMALHIAPFGPETTAMVVTRDGDFSDPLKDLLKQIDGAVEKNPASRLHPVVVLLCDDDKRAELTAKLEEQAKGLMLQHAEIVAAGKDDLAKYNLDDAGFAFFLSRRDKLTASRVLKKDDKLTGEVVKEILNALVEKPDATGK